MFQRNLQTGARLFVLTLIIKDNSEIDLETRGKEILQFQASLGSNLLNVFGESPKRSQRSSRPPWLVRCVGA